MNNVVRNYTGAALGGLFDALLPVVPYAPRPPSSAPRRRSCRPRPSGPRVALIADGIEAMHGVTRTIEQIRERGVPGFEVEVVGTDPGVDRRLPAAAALEVPFYEGMRLGVPGLPDLVETLAEGRYDLVHVTAPGPAGVSATLLSRVTGMPLIGSYHTELGAYAGLRSGDGGVEAMARMALGAFYAAPSTVLSPSPAADRSLIGLGADPARIGRWERGVDIASFDPAKADREAFPGEIKVLYAGRLTREKGVDLLAESFLRAHGVDPRLHLLLAGGGPEEEELRAKLGERATFLGWLGERGAGPRLRQRRHLPLLLAHRHLRPGRGRGRGQRPAGRRRRRGRPRLADREPPHRDALPRRRRPPRRLRPAARLLAAAAPPPRLLGPCAPPASAPGSGPWSSSPAATGGPWSEGAGQAAARAA